MNGEMQIVVYKHGELSAAINAMTAVVKLRKTGFTKTQLSALILILAPKRLRLVWSLRKGPLILDNFFVRQKFFGLFWCMGIVSDMEYIIGQYSTSLYKMSHSNAYINN